jgi:hypothetical protein
MLNSPHPPKGAFPVRLIRLIPSIALALFCLATPSPTRSQSDKLTVIGKLTRVMAIGAETSGWAIELNPVLTVQGKQVSSLEVKTTNTRKLESLENKTVKATGTLSNAIGVETGQRPVLNLSSIKPIKERPTKDN